MANVVAASVAASFMDHTREQRSMLERVFVGLWLRPGQWPALAPGLKSRVGFLLTMQYRRGARGITPLVLWQASLTTQRIQLRATEAWDLRLRPFSGATHKILDTNMVVQGYSLVDLAAWMDEAACSFIQEGSAPVRHLLPNIHISGVKAPQFGDVFADAVENGFAVEKADIVSAYENGEPARLGLGVCRRTGVVRSVSEGRGSISFDIDGEEYHLPKTVRIHPAVRPGAVVEGGNRFADLSPQLEEVDLELLAVELHGQRIHEAQQDGGKFLWRNFPYLINAGTVSDDAEETPLVMDEGEMCFSIGEGSHDLRILPPKLWAKLRG